MKTSTRFAQTSTALLCAASLWWATAALAQTTAPPKDKAPAKQANVPAKQANAAPAAKPRVRLMTQDELRVCFKEQADNRAEATAIELEKTAFDQERAALVSEKEETLKRTQSFEEKAKAVMAELEVLKAEQAALSKPPEKSEMKAYEVRRVAFNERADAHGRKVDAFNAEKREYDKVRLAMDARIEANNARGRTLKTRAENYNDTIDSYKVNCLNKPYDTADEAIVKKEMQAATPK